MEKGSLLSKWLNRKGQNERKTSAGASQNQTEFPLTPNQHRLWFLQKLFPTSHAYQVAERLLIKGDLDTSRLELCLGKLIERHDVFRAGIKEVGGTPLLFVRDKVDFQLGKKDFSTLPTNSAKEQAHQTALELIEEMFDLENDLIFRATLIKVASDQWQLLIITHHMLLDKWSMDILIREMTDLYRSSGDVDTGILPKLDLAFVDHLSGSSSRKATSESLDYWKTRLAGDLPISALPLDRPRPPVPSFSGAFLEDEISSDTSAKLRRIASESNTTMYVLLMTAFKILLAKYAGQCDVIIGSPVTLRNSLAEEKTIGFFDNTVVFRSLFSTEDAFLAVLQKVHREVMTSMTHKDTPFESVVNAVKPPRSLATNPLFQVMFIYQQAPKPLEFGGLSLEKDLFDFGVTKLDLSLYISDHGDVIRPIIEYSSDLFDPSTIARMLGHYRTLLSQIADSPEAPISQLEILTDREKKQLQLFNQTALTLRAGTPISLFDHHVLSCPDAKAVTFDGDSLSYSALDKKANALAALLTDRGAQPGEVVGLCAERSFEMIIGIIGILKAGCAYLPLDPEYPSVRLKQMVDDCDCKRAVTALGHDHLLAGFELDLLAINTTAEAHISAQSESSSDGLAYVIFTSGSSGKPKGVRITHSNLYHSLQARFHYYTSTPKAFLLLSSFSFDSSVAGIFWTLCSGGNLVLPPKRAEQDIHLIQSLLIEYAVSHTLLLPTLYQAILSGIEKPEMLNLEAVVLAGEACTVQVCKSHFQKLPSVHLFNEYGPTEATVWCTVHQIQEEDITSVIPIGKPIPNYQCYILDEQIMQVPIGVPGHLYIGGAGIAAGYTSADRGDAFTSNPYLPSGTMYRTGDMAMYRADGTIEFLGRKDQQVKIRGYRIELDEINSAALEIEGVSEAISIIQSQPAQPMEIERLLESLGEETVEKALDAIETMDEELVRTLIIESR